ncbi:unnamed protein product [Hymenolepis diminuta]|uniref:Uncharacterized protein n=1 Tax=Hymenolepis diminuta TaxID=6216 RepID=A0A564YWP2_HYMDI|nr:unnamed protein product [Hymenolepis diminuta]
MSKRVHRFPLFSIAASLHIKRHICAHTLAWPYPSDSYKAILVFRTDQRTLVSTDSYTSCSSPLFLNTLLSLSLLLIVASLNTFLVYSTRGFLLQNSC